MATNPDAITMTVAEFLRFEGEPDRRYELVDGRLRMMAAPSGEHGTVTVNVAVELDRRLERRSGCRAQIEAGIRIDDATFSIADVALTCNPERRSQITRDPLLIVEVLSPSTRTDDKGRKLDDYKSLDSVAEIWLVDSERRAVQVWWREPDGWSGRDFVFAASFESRVLEDRIALDRLYRNTDL
ncbi:MAG: Uma2 family endonuclease [Geminicoccaceae bacterium]|nr:Uma2 family endonuclease [Geminicoccaceae bacterium]